MTEPEGFLARWTRLKREAEEPREAAPRESVSHQDSPREAGDETRAAADASTAGAGKESGSTLPAVDLAALPSIESITAATDIRCFLVPGVPAELTRAALRRAWVVDPKIRDFIGIAENQWDFTADNAIPGFGPLGPLDDVRRLVAQVLGEKDEKHEKDGGPDAPRVATGSPQSVGNSGISDEHRGAQPVAASAASEPRPVAQDEIADETVDETVDVAMQHGVTSPAAAKRSHGGALPK